MQAITDVDVACGLWTSSHVSIRVETVRNIVVHDASAVGILLIDDGDPLRRLASRIRTAWTLRGAELAPPGIPPLPDGCVGLSPSSSAECRVATLLEQARRMRDVVRTLCLHGRLTAIRTWLPEALARNAEAAAAISRIELEATECTGAGPEFVGETRITEHDGCAAESVP